MMNGDPEFISLKLQSWVDAIMFEGKILGAVLKEFFLAYEQVCAGLTREIHLATFQPMNHHSEGSSAPYLGEGSTPRAHWAVALNVVPTGIW